MWPCPDHAARPRSKRQVTWHRFHEGTFVLGRQTIGVDEGVQIGVYAPERCIVDAFRLRHELGDDVAIEALKRWLRWPGAVPAELLRVARRFPKAEPSLIRTLQVLL